jgi:hypothetical protein
MAQSGRASLAVALLLVPSVGTASAECAWVLWDKTFECHGCSPTIYPLDAFPTNAACEQHRKKMVEAVELYDRATKASSTTTLTCLPDTVDPRGPKGK